MRLTKAAPLPTVVTLQRAAMSALIAKVVGPFVVGVFIVCAWNLAAHERIRVKLVRP